MHDIASKKACIFINDNEIKIGRVQKYLIQICELGLIYTVSKLYTIYLKPKQIDICTIN